MQQLSTDEILEQIKSSIRKLDKNFPEKIVTEPLENSVVFKFEDHENEGKKVCSLHFSVKDIWENKYDIPEAISEVIINKASELNIPVSRDPDIRK